MFHIISDVTSERNSLHGNNIGLMNQNFIICAVKSLIIIKDIYL